MFSQHFAFEQMCNFSAGFQPELNNYDETETIWSHWLNTDYGEWLNRNSLPQAICPTQEENCVDAEEYTSGYYGAT